MSRGKVIKTGREYYIHSNRLVYNTVFIWRVCRYGRTWNACFFRVTVYNNNNNNNNDDNNNNNNNNNNIVDVNRGENPARTVLRYTRVVDILHTLTNTDPLQSTTLKMSNIYIYICYFFPITP
jgi:hypothetical protein